MTIYKNDVLWFARIVTSASLVRAMYNTARKILHFRKQNEKNLSFLLGWTMIILGSLHN